MEIKERILEFIRINKKYFIIGIIFLLILVVPSIILLNIDNNKAEEKQVVYSNIEKEDIKEEIEEYIYVDIKGMIKNPGIYMMTSKDRVNDVINKAGGLLKGANTRYTNLSKKVIDEMVIVIYSEYEIEDKLSKIDKIDEVPCICESSISESTNFSESLIEETSEEESNGLVNINTASKETLMTLSGIGESKATAIIEYRNSNNGFKTKEEIMEVTGIGESIYNKVKDLITTE